MERDPGTTRRDATRQMTDVFLWGAALASTVGTVVLSLVPQKTLKGIHASDKFLHSAAYFAIAFWLLLAAVWRPGRGSGRFPGATWWIVGGAFGLGVVIEFVQIAFQRDADIRDALADGVGIALAWGLWRLLQWTEPRPSKAPNSP